MSQPFIAEIRIFGGARTPVQWAPCEGQIISISQHKPAYEIIGTIYGGNGKSNFALPDLRERTPMQAGEGSGLTPRTLGQRVGEDTVTLNSDHLPAHSHTLMASDQDGNLYAPNSKSTFATTVFKARPNRPGTAIDSYKSNDDIGYMDSKAVSSVGENMSHYNRQPYVGVRFIFCLNGIYPSPE